MPGRRARRPINTLFELLGKRWALRVLWELRSGPLSFRALRAAAADLSPSVLNARLGELRAAGIVASTDEGYALTDAGRELGKLLLALGEWADTHL